MRAIRVTEPGGPEVLTVGDAAVPEPAPGQVRVCVRCAGVNRADLLQRAGRYPAPPGSPPDIPGLEFAGEVDLVGSGVVGWHAGDRVMGIVGGGAYAEALVLEAGQLIPIPPAWSDEEAAAVPEAFITAHDALITRAGLHDGERVLVHAVGSGVGLALLQVAGAEGASVVGTSRSAWKLDRAAALGLDRAVQVAGEFDPDEGLQDWADVIADLVGGPYLAGNLRAAALQGRLVAIGLSGGRVASIDLGVVLRKRLTLHGTVLRGRSAAEKTAATRAFAGWALPRFEAGRLTPVLDRVFPMREAAEAHRYVEANRNFGSVVLAWD